MLDPRLLEAAAPLRRGVVLRTVGLSINVAGLPGRTGDILDIEGAAYEVVAADQETLTAMPLDPGPMPAPGTDVTLNPHGALIPVGPGLLGRVIDPLGRPMDGRGPLRDIWWVSEHAPAPSAMTRQRITAPLHTGVRAIDAFTTLGQGQRMGLFAGSGVGKSSLLSMIARGTTAEASVIALIGERGREVREFLEDDLGDDGLARSVVVIATGDQPALMRRKAAGSATRIAEGMRATGSNVLLMMDSLTRVAMAHREIALSAGEVPANRGYPPSMPSMLANLLERAGADDQGTISGIYTVLVDGDDHNDPVADAARSILDGHLVLDRALAVAGHFPSIDVLGSISRTASKTNPKARLSAVSTVRRAMGERRKIQDLIDVGAYQPGANPVADLALAAAGDIEAFLTQAMDEVSDPTQTWDALESLAQQLGHTS